MKPFTTFLRIQTLRASIPPRTLNFFQEEPAVPSADPKTIYPKSGTFPGGARYAVCSQCIRRGGCRRETVHGRRKRWPLDPDCRYVMILRPSHRENLSLLLCPAGTQHASSFPLFPSLLCSVILIGTSTFSRLQTGLHRTCVTSWCPSHLTHRHSSTRISP